METQATKMTLGQKALAVIMSIVLVVGLAPAISGAQKQAYADDTLVAAQLGELATQADLVDGTYEVTGLTAEVLHMYHFDADSVSVVVSGGQAQLITVATEANTIKRFDGMAYGKQSEILDENDATNKTLKAGTPTATVTDEKDAQGNVTKRTFALPVDKSVLEDGEDIYYMVKYRDGYSESHNGDWYKAEGGDYYFDGYSVWSTTLELTNNVSMFRPASAMLSSDGEKVRITMENDSFTKVALCKAGKIDEETDTYDIVDTKVELPVSELGDGSMITTSWLGKDSQEWRERDLTFDEDAKTLTFDTTVKNVDEIDKLGSVEAVKAAIAGPTPTLVVTPKMVDDMIEAIQVQYRDEKTDFYCETAKILWDALDDAGKDKVKEGGYFADPTGDAEADDTLNADGISEKEILVVSFGTSFNDSRAQDIGGVEKAIAAANPDWSVRRAFTAQIIINHVQARDGKKIDNVEQAMNRAVDNGVKTLIVQPTHLMHGAEYDELKETIDQYASKMTIRYAEPLLGEVGATATDVNADKKAVAEAITAEALSPLNYPSLDLAGKDGKIAFVFMGHGTGHDANVTYAQMQEQMDQLGYENVYIGSVESEDVGDEPRTAASIIERASAAGYKNIILRPLMVVAGDHANNDMAGDEEDSWKSMFIDSKKFDSVNCQIEGLGRIADIQKMYVDHTAAAKTVTVPTAAKNLVYNAEKQTGVAAGAGYTLSGTTSAKDAGSYKATATLESGLVWNDETTDAKQIKWSIAQAKAAAKVTKTKSLKVKSLKKKAASFTAIKLTTDGKATWKVIKNSNKKAISFKAGKVTVKKGTAKGTYTLKVQASAKAGKNYKALNAKTYKITVKVK